MKTTLAALLALALTAAAQDPAAKDAKPADEAAKAAGAKLAARAARNLLSPPPHRGRPERGPAPGSEGVWGERGAGKGGIMKEEG